MDIKSINIWKEEPKKDTSRSLLENSGIECLGLNVRAYNGLKRAGCSTVGEVLAIIGPDGDGIKSIRNLGDKSQKEILEKIEVLAQTYRSSETSPVYSSTAKRVLMVPDGKTWNRDIRSYMLNNDTYSRLKECGISRVGDIYSTAIIKDPGWKAVKELFDQIVKEAG